MEKLSFNLKAPNAAGGTRAQAIVGVVASGNLEVLLERVLPAAACTVDIATAAHGFGAVWQAVVGDFVADGRPAACVSRSTTEAPGRTCWHCASPKACA
jgi:malonate decarboxylase acyl carrier protein